MANAARPRAPRTPRVVVVGAGMGGLAAALDLARQGLEVVVLERAAGPGGKMRQVMVDGAAVDAGPTVFTMRWVFDELFADAGTALEDHVGLTGAEVLARHAWAGGGRLDLFADVARSADAIAAFAGPRDADGYRALCARSAEIYRTLAPTFIAAHRPGPFTLARRVGLSRLGALWATSPFTSLWSALGRHFADVRLRQLFARYATYVGSSPFQAPATLMLIAHVEQEGVWLVEGGMAQVARALQVVAEGQGARFRFGAPVAEILVERGRTAGVVLADGERIEADAVVFNGDPTALATGRLGHGVMGAFPPTPPQHRSLSALTWCLHAPARGFPLSRHTVFFGEDYRAEFDAIFRRRTIAVRPTVYVCAQDRAAGGELSGDASERERLLVLINAPALGDLYPLGRTEIADLAARAGAVTEACGLGIALEDGVAATPTDFEGLFPGTGGALYGRANHGPFAAFARPGARAHPRGLYLAGGGVHPGAGVPMATVSGRLAAARVVEDLGS